MKKTTCRNGVRVLMQYTDGVLPDSRRSAVEDHVGACRRCKGFVRSYAETPRILREATVTRMPERIGRRLHRMLVALPTPGRDRS
jgi:anti-sigma factor RsiW